MFKKFGPDEVKDKSKIKSSQQRAICRAIQYASKLSPCNHWTAFSDHQGDGSLQARVPLLQAKLGPDSTQESRDPESQVAKYEGKNNMVMIEGDPLFHNVRQGPY